jgi:uncharacterized protein YdaU (DUF1376 family)
MNDLSYIPLNPTDFLADGKVSVMTTEEVGAYILLLLHAWKQDIPGTLPNNDIWLSRWTRTTPEQWADISASVMSPFEYNEEEDRWEQRRLIRTYAQVKETLDKRSQSGLKAANARWNKESECNANAMLNSKTENNKTESTTRRQKITWSESSGWIGIDDDQMSMWSTAYPNTNVEGELAKMSTWLDANPSKRKKQYKRFINAWLNRSNEKGTNDGKRTEYDEPNIGRTIQIG